MTIKSENQLPRYASGQKSLTDGRTERLRMDEQRQNNMPPNLLDNKILKLKMIMRILVLMLNLAFIYNKYVSSYLKVKLAISFVNLYINNIYQGMENSRTYVLRMTIYSRLQHHIVRLKLYSLDYLSISLVWLVNVVP